MIEGFTLSDIKAGMLVFVKHYGSGDIFSSQVYDTKHGLCVSTEKHWFMLSSLSETLLKDDWREIVEVWDRCPYSSGAHRVSICDRSLLWRRKEPKKLTISQIENLLGYEIEVVAENE